MTSWYPSQILLGKDILILENVGHLDRMPLTGATVVIGVVKLYDGSGAPMRLLALVNTDQPNGDCKQQAAPVSFGVAVTVSFLLALFLQ